MNILHPKFALLREPCDHQITVHYHNYEAVYGTGSFSRQLQRATDKCIVDPNMHNFVLYYGIDKLQDFLLLIFSSSVVIPNKGAV